MAAYVYRQRSGAKTSEHTASKLTPLKQNASFCYALFSENGFDEKIVKESDTANLRLYPLEAIVNYK